MIARLPLIAAIILLGLAWPAAAQQQSQLNLISGAASATNGGATMIIAAVSPAALGMRITEIQCGRVDAGTTASHVTFNDSASTILVLPNSGGGGTVSANFAASPLIVAANTAFTFTSSASITTVYCNAQGFASH
jgi:hypothetical protein